MILSIDWLNLSIKVDNHRLLRAGYPFESTFIDFCQHQHVKGTDMEVQKQLLALSTLYTRHTECKQLYGADNGNKPE